MKQITVHIASSFYRDTQKGKYILVIAYNGKSKWFDSCDIDTTSEARIVLLAIIDMIQRLKEPCVINLITAGNWGNMAIRDKKTKAIKQSPVSEKEVNWDLKEKIRSLLVSNNHMLLATVEPKKIWYLRQELKIRGC